MSGPTPIYRLTTPIQWPPGEGSAADYQGLANCPSAFVPGAQSWLSLSYLVMPFHTLIYFVMLTAFRFTFSTASSSISHQKQRLERCLAGNHHWHGCPSLLPALGLGLRPPQVHVRALHACNCCKLDTTCDCWLHTALGTSTTNRTILILSSRRLQRWKAVPRVPS